MTKEVMHTKAAAIEQLSFSASAGQTALAHLCGPLDENLRQMETILGVKIVRRGEQFRVSGEKHAAHRALRALEVLLDRVARTGAELTPNDIQWHFVGGDDEHRAKTANAFLKLRSSIICRRLVQKVLRLLYPSWRGAQSTARTVWCLIPAVKKSLVRSLMFW